MIENGWTAFKCGLSKDEEDIFLKVTHGILGVGYEPIAVASQLVAGMNYRFFCNTKVVYPNAPNDAAVVTIYAPPDGTPHITEIKRVE